jgi:hypothetical protein
VDWQEFLRMGKILDFIEKTTQADRSSQSFKYCFESADIPQL